VAPNASSSEEPEESKEDDSTDGGESSAMMQSEKAKSKLLSGKKRLYQKEDLQELIAQTIAGFIGMFDPLL